MSSNIVPFDRSKLPPAVAGVVAKLHTSDLSQGVAGGFPIVSFRGSKWRIRAKGEDTLVVDDEGEAKPFVDIVLLQASPAISKTYYESAYEEGSDEAPTCVAVRGDKPDPNSTIPQSPTCATCRHNVWGSKITPTGKKAKACADSRRMAVVPAGDIPNDVYGGPMLLRVPAASLDDLATFGREVERKGYPYNIIVTRVGFGPQASYPKLTFKALRPLTAEQLGQLNTVYGDMDRIERILSEAQEFPFGTVKKTEPPAAAAPAVDTSSLDGLPPATPVDKKPRKPRTAAPAAAAPAVPSFEAPLPAAATKPAAPKAAAPLDNDLLSASLDDLLGELEAGA